MPPPSQFTSSCCWTIHRCDDHQQYTYKLEVSISNLEHKAVPERDVYGGIIQTIITHKHKLGRKRDEELVWHGN